MATLPTPLHYVREWNAYNFEATVYVMHNILPPLGLSFKLQRSRVFCCLCPNSVGRTRDGDVRT